MKTGTTRKRRSGSSLKKSKWHAHLLRAESCDGFVMHAELWREAELAQVVKGDNSGGLRLAVDPNRRREKSLMIAV